MVDFGKFVEGLKGLIIQAEAEQTPPPVPPVVPAGPTPDPTQSGGATPLPLPRQSMSNSLRIPCDSSIDR